MTTASDGLRHLAAEFRELAKRPGNEPILCSRRDFTKWTTAIEAQFPADDGEPVTPNRLMAAGARHDGFGQYTVGTGPWTLSFFDDGPGELYIKAAFFCKSPTWGQFRRLAAVLGIALPAAATDGPAAE